MFRRVGSWQAWLLLGFGLCFTGLACDLMMAVLDEEAEQDFKFACEALRARVEERLHAHEQILRSGAGFFAHRDEVDREEWHEFAKRQKVDQTLPGIQGIGFAKLVPREQLAAHLREIRDEGFSEYRIWPEGERDVYSSVVFLEPFSGRNLRAFGYDMLAEPVRRAAMEQARDEDATVLSGKVMLVQEDGQDVQTGTLMYAPVYRMGEARATLAERRAAIMGWVYSPYRMNDLMHGVLGRRESKDARQIHLKIFDGTEATPAALLYDSTPGSSKLPAAATLMCSKVSVRSAGHDWLLSFVRSTGPGGGTDYSKAWLVGCGGVLSSLLLAGLVHSLYSTRGKVEVLARRLTKDLSQSEERWKYALEGAGDGVWDWNMGAGKVVYTKSWKRLLGYAENELGEGLEEWNTRVHPDDKPGVLEQLNAHLADPSVAYVCEYRMRCKDGSWKWVLDRGCVVTRDGADQAERMIGTLKDISARRQVEIEFARLSVIQRELLRLATKFVNVPLEAQDAAINESLALMGRLIGVDRAKLFSYDFDAGTFSNTHEWCAPGVASTIGNSQAVAIDQISDATEGHRRGELVSTADADSLPAASLLRQKLKARGICSLVSQPLMHDGDCWGFMSFENLESKRKWTAEEEALLGVLAQLYANFEARRRMESEARELQLRLTDASVAAQAAVAAKSLFLANMSHEIRTPLNAILGYSQIMELDCRSCAKSGRLSAINRSGEHLLTLVTDLLELVRSDSQPLTLKPEDFDFYRVLEDVRLMFASLVGAPDLMLELSPNVPRFIHSDQGKIRQILVNLVGNAFKFTPKGSVRMAASVVAEAVSGTPLVAVDVEDSGCGIEEADLERIFEVFEQAEDGRRSGKGTGLGLPLSRRFARALGGDVTVTSRLGGGSCFRVTFGLRDASHDSESHHRSKVLELAPQQPECRILVVDDDPENRAMLVEMLVAAGFAVEVVASGAHALQRFEEGCGTDLVLLDRQMPGMDGYETLGHLRELPGGGSLRVLMVTAAGAAEDRAQALAAGVDGFISKPVWREDLLAEIGRLTGVRYVYHQVATATAPSDVISLASLPAELRHSLAVALRRGDIRRLREWLAELTATQPALAAQLSGLVNAYAYERLGALLDDVKGNNL